MSASEGAGLIQGGVLPGLSPLGPGIGERERPGRAQDGVLPGGPGGDVLDMTFAARVSCPLGPGEADAEE